MDYEDLSEQEKRIWDRVYADAYSKYGDAYYATTEANQSIHDLRYEKKQAKKRW